MLADAAQFRFPAGNLVIFLYNPFGDTAIAEVAEAVNAGIAAIRTVLCLSSITIRLRATGSMLPRLRRYLAATLPYATDELGYGPDSEDPIVIWQTGVRLLELTHARIPGSKSSTPFIA